MKPFVSVIICTHNPRRDYLDKVLTALKQQSLPVEQWELFLIDNASDRSLSAEIDLTWHPQAHHVREDQLGLTPARLRGIRESHSDLLVFVDDDNVLEPNYLELAIEIADRWFMLGIWGGQTIAGFDEPPPEWTKPYWGCLALREFARDSWSNVFCGTIAPVGAGLCARRTVMQHYAALIEANPMRLQLDRKGKTLTGYGDTDIVLNACEMGYGMGLFHSLRLTHLIPSFRLQEEYLLRLRETDSYSYVIFQTVLGFPPVVTWRRKLLNHCRRWLMDARSRRFYDASQRGIELALKELMAKGIESERNAILNKL